MDKKIYTASVRTLAHWDNISGDIDNRYVATDSMNEGAKAHRLLQKQYGEDDISELSIKDVYENDFASLIVSGRIDGVLSYKTDPVIEEIKSFSSGVPELSEPFAAHLAQCKIYAAIYASSHSLERIKLKMNYYFIAQKKSVNFTYELSNDELMSYYSGLCERYLAYLKSQSIIADERDESIRLMPFPFEYRKFQKSIVAGIYKAIKGETNLFLSAPTGSGKTIDALFASLKALVDLGEGSKIFYLSSKSTQKEIAKLNIDTMLEGGLKIKALMISAKEKVCRLEKPSCNPDDCPYAAKYYDKLKGVMKKMSDSLDVFTPEAIMEYALEYTLCPFELSLDLSLISDVIICDYNYVFDPSAYLSRYFGEESEKREHIFLVDEAHNLVDRSRDMYSSELIKTEILACKKACGEHKQIAKALGKINTALLNISKEPGENIILSQVPQDIINSVYLFQNAANEFLAQTKKRDEAYSAIYEMYFKTVKFMNIFMLMGTCHRVFFERERLALRLFCCDASSYLRDCMKKAKASILFSATLAPLRYHRDLLGGRESDKCAFAQSAFEKENFLIGIDTSVSTTYKKRELYYTNVAQKIKAFSETMKGNVIAFFPSYAYMQSVYERYSELYPRESALIQSRGLDEAGRNEFLDRFTIDSTLTAFAVTGGAFSESVDLCGERLVGVVVCGVSLPMVCPKRELIKDYYDEQGYDGFEYAYIIPGMNKVLQAMGRVIRTELDRGAALLLDERFGYAPYTRCFPPHYSELSFLETPRQLEEFLERAEKFGG